MYRILAGIFACGGLLWAAAVDPISGVDVAVEAQPTGSGPIVSATSDVSGRFRFDITKPGAYTIVATQINPPAALVGLKLQGTFSAPIGTAPAGALVTGANVNGNSFMAAGFAGPQHEQILSVGITASAPVHFSGSFSEDSFVTVIPPHLTFYAVAGGPSPFPQPVWLINNSAGAVQYSATVQAVGTPVTVNLPQASGTVAAGASASVSVAPLIQNLAAGTYSALLNISQQTAGAAAVNSAVGVTLFVQQSTATNGTIGVDHVTLPSYPLSGGAATPVVFTVTNLSAPIQNYTFQVDPSTGSLTDATIVPAQAALATGQSQAFQVQPKPGKSPTYVITASLTGAVARVSTVALPNPGGSCTPTRLIPLVDTINAVATGGFPINVTLRASDDCGNFYSTFTTALSLGAGGAQSQLLTMQQGAPSRAWARIASAAACNLSPDHATSPAPILPRT